MVGAVWSVDDRRGITCGGVLDVLADELYGSVAHQEVTAADMSAVEIPVLIGRIEWRAIEFLMGRPEVKIGTVVVRSVIGAIRTAAGGDVAVHVLTHRTNIVDAVDVGDQRNPMNFTDGKDIGCSVGDVPHIPFAVGDQQTVVAGIDGNLGIVCGVLGTVDTVKRAAATNVAGGRDCLDSLTCGHVRSTAVVCHCGRFHVAGATESGQRRSH